MAWRLLRSPDGRTPAGRSRSRQPQSRLAPLGERCDAKSAAAWAAPASARERPTRHQVPTTGSPKHAGAVYFGPISSRSPGTRTFAESPANVHTVRSPPYNTGLAQTRAAIATEIAAIHTDPGGN